MTPLEQLGVALARYVLDAVCSCPETGVTIISPIDAPRLERYADDLLREARRVARPSELA